MSDYGARAAFALNQLLPGQHREKTAARIFRCSVRFARYLRAGQGWTTEHLSRASEVLGIEFDLLLSNVDFEREIADMRQRMAQLETLLARESNREDRAALGGASADEASRAAVVAGRENRAEVARPQAVKRRRR